MRSYFYETESDLPPAQLYRAIIDIRSWPEWDTGLEFVSLAEPADEGVEFTVKPRGRSTVPLRIETMIEPYRFADIAYLPLAQMRTEHAFIPNHGGTLVRSSLEIRGLLAPFWDRPLAENYAAGAAVQTRHFLAFARSYGAGRQKPNSIGARSAPNYVFC